MKEPEIIGDDYPTYEEIINQAKAVTTPPDIPDQLEMDEGDIASYDHMLTTFEWWSEYLAKEGPKGVSNIAGEIIKYAHKLKSVDKTSSCCGDSNCEG